MNSLKATSLEEKKESKILDPNTSKLSKSTMPEDDEWSNVNGDHASPLYKFANEISWSNMQLYIDLMEDEKEGKMLNQSALMRQSQSCSNIQCKKSTHSSGDKKKSKKSRRSSANTEKAPESSPARRLSMTGTIYKRVASLRTIWSKPETPDTKVISEIKQYDEPVSPQSVLTSRPKISHHPSYSIRKMRKALSPNSEPTKILLTPGMKRTVVKSPNEPLSPKTVVTSRFEYPKQTSSNQKLTSTVSPDSEHNEMIQTSGVTPDAEIPLTIWFKRAVVKTPEEEPQSPHSVLTSRSMEAPTCRRPSKLLRQRSSTRKLTDLYFL